LAWPCPTGKRQLVAEFHHAYASMMIYLAGYFVQACEDLSDAPVGGVHARFLGWAGSPQVRGAVTGHEAAPTDSGSAGGSPVVGHLRTVAL
jgi:hypothetical protein